MGVSLGTYKYWGYKVSWSDVRVPPVDGRDKLEHW